MSEITITELGRKWYGVAITFNDDDIERVSPDVLRGLGGKLRYDNTGGLRALFHFNITRQENSEAMIKILKYFGEDGYFHHGVDFTLSAAKSVCESDTAIQTITDRVNNNCRNWSEQWQEIIETSLLQKKTRIQLLRQIQALDLPHISETDIREYMEKRLRQKYSSDLFVATFMWRLGWPDQRKPFTAATKINTYTAAG